MDQTDEIKSDLAFNINDLSVEIFVTILSYLYIYSLSKIERGRSVKAPKIVYFY